MVSSNNRTHQFANGIVVYERYLNSAQVERYATLNLHEPEEEEIFAASLDGVSDGVFLDVGAAIGYYSLLAQKLAPGLEIHAFEPLPEYRQAIREHLLLNNLPTDAIAVSPTAVGATEGTARFAAAGYGSRLGVRLRDVVRGRARPLRVATTTIDGVVASIEPRVRLVKVDVQGGERDVLKGSQATLLGQRVEAWLIGTHSRQLHQDCLKLLADPGYMIERDVEAPAGQPDGIILARRRA